MTDYQKLEGNFWDKQPKSLNPVLAWFSSYRHKAISNLVKKNYTPGKIVVDFGCGNCIWNTFGAKVIGIDINKKLTKHALEKNRIYKAVNSDFLENNLKNSTADIVVCSETLEHLPKYKEVLKEINRVMKPNGSLLISVPRDTNLSLWKWLFKIQCFIQWRVFQKEYYKNECGHINHFSMQKIANEIELAGFDIVKKINGRYMTIFIEAKKNNL